VETKTKDLLGFSFGREQWERDGKTVERSVVRRLVKFEICVCTSLVTTNCTRDIPSPSSLQQYAEIKSGFRLSTIKIVRLLTA